MSKSKGDRRERQAEEIYEAAGYKTERSQGQRWGRTDWFGLFDVMALHPDRKVRFCQVKSNAAKGIRKFLELSAIRVPDAHAELDYLVCHDREGWRLIRPHEDTYRTVVDERKMDVEMGEGVAEYLRGEA